MRNIAIAVILFWLALVAAVGLAHAQSPPQIPLAGNIGIMGSAAILGGTTVQVPSDANYTLTPAQWWNKTLIITSATSLTASRNIVAPLNKGQEFNVENNTTGGQSIVIMGASGTGVTIANGSTALVFSDGVNYLTDTAPFPVTNGGVYNTSSRTSRPMVSADITSLLGYTPATGPNFTNDFIACYLFLETPVAGGVLPDHCGNNNGTLGAVAPGFDGVGWRFTNYVTNSVVLPAALNNAKSYYIAISVPASLGGGWTAPQVNTILGSTVASQMDINATNTASQPFGGVSAFGGAGITTVATGNVFNGLAIITLVCGSSTDTVYFNGHLMPNTHGGVSTCGHMASGSLEIGASADSSNFSLAGEIYDIRVSNNTHTAQQVAQNVAALTNEIIGRGVSFIPATYQYPSQQLFFAGDSITCGFAAGGSPPCATGTVFSQGTTSSNSFTNHLVLDQAFGINNFGQPGAQVQQQVAAASQIYSPFCGTQYGSSVAVLFEGTNNGGVTTPAQTWNYAVSWAQTLHAAGCKTIYVGMISRGGTISGGTYETFRYAYNALARANWKQAGFDAYVDSDADPFLGCTGCNANTTYFTNDVTHPTATGQLKLAAEVQAGINYLTAGSTPANPNPTVITASTYTSIYEDGGLIFNTAGNNIVDTLTSAQWMSGRIISRCNTSTSGTNTLTITAPSDYPFNNVTGNTTVVVPNNTCQKFQATYLSGSPSNGDFWRLVQ